MDAGEAMGCARALEQHADEMLHASGRIGGLAAGMAWESPAASVARREVDGVVATLRRSAGELRQAAESVRRHGMAVETAWATLARATREVDELAAAGARSVRRAVESGGGPGRLAGRAAS